MTVGTKFQQYVEDLHHGVHDFSSDQLVVALTAAEPSASADAVLTDLPTQASYTNCSTRNITLTSSGQTTGTYTLVLQDLTLTASGGPVGPFQYVTIYNDTPTVPADPLIAYYDVGSSVTLLDGESYIIDQLGSLISST